jgi:hypothetical protein
MATRRKKITAQKRKQHTLTRLPRTEKVRVIGAYDLAVIRLRAFTVIEHAVAKGAEYGVRQAHLEHLGKGTSQPSQEVLTDRVTNTVMSALKEVLDFGDE